MSIPWAGTEALHTIADMRRNVFIICSPAISVFVGAGLVDGTMSKGLYRDFPDDTMVLLSTQDMQSPTDA
jgi:hypothetical protein